ncbi:MAG: hypothetical protein V9E94_07685 [Microthrixaceae bacterium]
MSTETDPSPAPGVTEAGSPSSPPRRAGRSARAVMSNLVTYLLLTLLSLLILFPIYMLILRALSAPLRYIAAGQPLHPVDIQWDVFANAFTQAGLGRPMLLSFVVTMVIVIAQLLSSVLAAYRVRVPRLPGQDPHVRARHRHLAPADRGDPDRQRREHQSDERHELAAGPLTAVPGDRARHLPDPPGIPGHPT